MASSQMTSGDYKLEKDAENSFDSLINPKYFSCEKNIKGRRLFDDKPVSDKSGQVLIPDRVLHPTDESFESGWFWGPIGVEIKRSNIKLGPVFAQVIEQRQSILLSNWLNNTRILPIVYSIFPVKSIKNNLHSISMSQIILSCSQENDKLVFRAGDIFVLSVSDAIEVNKNWKPTTRKGHRG